MHGKEGDGESVEWHRSGFRTCRTREFEDASAVPGDLNDTWDLPGRGVSAGGQMSDSW